MPSNPPFLIRSRHGIYYFRLVIPQHLRPELGRSEIRRSLHTRSKRDALLLSAQLLLESQSLLGRHSAPVLPVHTLPALTSSPNLTGLLDEYAQLQQHSGISQKTIDDKASVVRLLAKVIGDIPIDAVSSQEARSFRDTALQLPPLAARKLSKQPELRIQDMTTQSDASRP